MLHRLAESTNESCTWISQPDELLFIYASVYTCRALDELAASAWHVGVMQDGREAIDRLIAEQRFPESDRSRLEGDHRFYFQSA